MRKLPMTAMQVKTLQRRQKPGNYCVGDGLYLQIAAGGSESWFLRYQLNGRKHDMGLGSVKDFSLAEARIRARQARQLRTDGIDPIGARRAEREKEKLEAAKAMTFRACAEAYIKAHSAKWSRRHAAEWPRSLGDYVYPVFGDLPVQAVDVGLVMKALEPFWQTKTVTAGRVRGRIESVLDWATARGYRQGENPARWRGHLENLLPKGDKVGGSRIWRRCRTTRCPRSWPSCVARTG